MSERPGAITFKGNPMTLVGNELAPGDAAPDFALIANDLSEKQLSDFTDKTIILSAVPSLDTGVCDVETRTFNEKAAALGDDVTVLTVSLDLPFAQKRWCASAGIDRVVTLSDYKHGTFGKAYGILIKELGLLARCIFVIKDGKITYIQLVPEVAEEPDYDAVIEAAK
ncbi:thiol peroxidase [Planctomycetales bacterium ZRK34]|nr:thiol peroxidase [Planctomycetales bacterium ZRK34]